MPSLSAPAVAAASADLPPPAAPRLRVRGVASALVAPTTFSLAAGHCLVVEGPSGAGKTRLLRLLADLDEGQGEVWLDDRARSAIPAPQWRREVLYQAAQPGWWADSVMAHLPASQHAAAVALAARLALTEDRLHADLAQLSSGERQRAALLRSLLAAPAVLMLDEPTSALDADNVARVEAVLRERLQQGMALILITHAQEQAQRLADARLQVARREVA